MAILLTNDDGIDAPGIAVLRSVANGWGPILVVAPETEQSGVGHRVTDQHPISVQKRDGSSFAISGTPADCARLGLLHLGPDSSWVLSGINAGGNLGSDTYMSGTVAAAREAALLGRRAIALSQYRFHLRPMDWERSSRWCQRVLSVLFEIPLNVGEFWNVNFPDPDDPRADPEIVFCEVDPGHHAVEFEETVDGYMYRGKYRERHRHPGFDVDICFSGDIAISKISTRSPSATGPTNSQ